MVPLESDVRDSVRVVGKPEVTSKRSRIRYERNAPRYKSGLDGFALPQSGSRCPGRDRSDLGTFAVLLRRGRWFLRLDVLDASTSPETIEHQFLLPKGTELVTTAYFDYLQT